MKKNMKLRFINFYAQNKEQKTVNATKDGIDEHSIVAAVDNMDSGGDKLVPHLLNITKHSKNYKYLLSELTRHHNPVSLKPEHIEAIMQNHREGKSMGISAARLNLTPEHLEELSNDSNALIRSSVVINKNLTKSTYDKLIGDPDLGVRQHAAHSHHFTPPDVNKIYHGEYDEIDDDHHLLHKLNHHGGKPFKYTPYAFHKAVDNDLLDNSHAKTIKKFGELSDSGYTGKYEYHPVDFENCTKKGDELTDLYLENHVGSTYNPHRSVDIAGSGYFKDHHVDKFIAGCKDLDDHDKTDIINSLKNNDNISSHKKQEAEVNLFKKEE